ncbi:MAG: hypothetical protein ACYC6W_09820 [Nitrosotalea sp.]
MLRSTTVDGIIFACNEFYAEKHGGHIDIKTEVGKGTTFIINIPK